MCFFLLAFLIENGKDFELLGDNAFIEGNYETALNCYYDAFESAEVFWKRARVLSVLRTQDMICEYNAFVDIILENLYYAIEREPDIRAVVVTDTILQPVQNTVLFNIWKGTLLENDSSLATLLPAVSWYNCLEAITGVEGGIVFREDGSVFVDWGTYYEYDEVTDSFQPHPYGKQDGTYFVRNGKIHITWHRTYESLDDAAYSKSSVYVLKILGVVGMLMDDDSGLELFIDMPDECNT